MFEIQFFVLFLYFFLSFHNRFPIWKSLYGWLEEGRLSFKESIPFNREFSKSTVKEYKVCLWQSDCSINLFPCLEGKITYRKRHNDAHTLHARETRQRCPPAGTAHGARWPHSGTPASECALWQLHVCSLWSGAAAATGVRDEISSAGSASCCRHALWSDRISLLRHLIGRKFIG